MQQVIYKRPFGEKKRKAVGDYVRKVNRAIRPLPPSLR